EGIDGSRPYAQVGEARSHVVVSHRSRVRRGRLVPCTRSLCDGAASRRPQVPGSAAITSEPDPPDPRRNPLLSTTPNHPRPRRGPRRPAPAERSIIERTPVVVHHEPRDGVTWDELGVPQPLIQALAKQGLDAPFPIQVATLPDT